MSGIVFCDIVWVYWYIYIYKCFAIIFNFSDDSWDNKVILNLKLYTQ